MYTWNIESLAAIATYNFESLVSPNQTSLPIQLGLDKIALVTAVVTLVVLTVVLVTCRKCHAIILVGPSGSL